MAKKLDLVITEEHLRVTWNNYLSAQEISGPDYAGAVTDIHQMGRIVSEFFKDFDLILSLVSHVPHQKSEPLIP